MRITKDFVVIVILCLSSTAYMGCTTTRASMTDAELLRFASMLSGDYTSTLQSERDTTYFDIRLSMHRIWNDRSDGVWLYVEQAMARRPDKPYRQRVYRLTRVESDVFVSDIYSIANATEVVGAQRSEEKSRELTFHRIEMKEGCSVRMRRIGDGYEGGTEGTGCASELRGARYATSVITLTPGLLVSWDRGYDENGQQVWGATKGGYEFVKE
ncbi:MAG: chromophore lyase CpcT/CpeT [Candidatus Kapaibacterium sp.]